MNYIDFHTHIFPDKIAKQAMDALAAESGEYRPHTDGTLSALLGSMDRADISASLVANIATKPAQLVPILEFCKQIKSDRIHPLISFHPSNDPEEVEDIFGQASARASTASSSTPCIRISLSTTSTCTVFTS